MGHKERAVDLSRDGGFNTGGVRCACGRQSPRIVQYPIEMIDMGADRGDSVTDLTKFSHIGHHRDNRWGINTCRRARQCLGGVPGSCGIAANDDDLSTSVHQHLRCCVANPGRGAGHHIVLAGEVTGGRPPSVETPPYPRPYRRE